VLTETAAGHCFIPVSPDDRHLGGSHKTASRLLQLMMGPWTLKELECGFPYMIFVNPSEAYVHTRQVYDDAMATMHENYYILGGLPRYLVKTKADERKKEITPEKAAIHSQQLLDALVTGENFSDSTRDRILTRFFTLRAGEKRMEWIQPQSIVCNTRLCLSWCGQGRRQDHSNKNTQDVTWRGQDDSSDIGLAFGRVVLIFLSQGTDGMQRLGIRARCRSLVTTKSGEKRCGGDSPAAPGVSFILDANSGYTEQAADSSAFETDIQQHGKGMTYKNSVLRTSKALRLPPDGYCNFDGMAGADLGLNATLQKNQTISGPGFIRQRLAYGLGEEDKFAHVFVVPKNRFDQGWTACQQFQWSGDDDEATTSRKRRIVNCSGRTPGKTVQKKQILEQEKAAARDSMYQFVLTLEIEEGNE